MQALVDNFSKLLEQKIKQINGLKKEGNSMQTLSKRVDLLSFIPGAKKVVTKYSLRSMAFAASMKGFHSSSGNTT